MSKPLRRVTVNIPSDLLEHAVRITGKGITQTLIEGLNELKRSRITALRKLRGKIRFDLDLERTRR